MPACEKCWADAYLASLHSGRAQSAEYARLVRDRRPCSPRDQAGQWWDEKQQCDTRLTLKGAGPHLC